MENWIRTFSDDYLSRVPEDGRDAVIREVEETLRPQLFRDGSWFADYRRIRVVAVRANAH
jgi:hypothetical protein